MPYQEYIALKDFRVDRQDLGTGVVGVGTFSIGEYPITEPDVFPFLGWLIEQGALGAMAAADAEAPSGTINGSNPTFTLAQPPSPVLSLQLFRNGLLQIQGYNYTLSGVTITFSAVTDPTSIPATGDYLRAWYRY